MQTRFIFVLYRALQTAAFPLVLLYAVWRCLRDGRYRLHLEERFGRLPHPFQRTARDSVWLHAASVGEVLSAVELIRRLRTALPGAPLFLSCTTMAGRDAANKTLAGEVDGIFYAPADYVFAVRAVLRRIRPATLVVFETEIWPNLFRETRRAGCTLVMVNARISDKSLPSYRRWACLFRHVLQYPNAILAQSSEQKRRFLAAGAPENVVHVAGNLKFDFDPAETRIPEAVRGWIKSRTGALLVAASTVGPQTEGDVDEDDAVISAMQSLNGTKLIIAPRKPERFDQVARKLNVAGIPFSRRSTLPDSSQGSVLLLDSIGELNSVFRYADVVFMGGTLARRGGHNLLEPAAFGCPVIAGPHLENFAEIQSRFRAGAAFLEIERPDELGPSVAHLLTSKDRAEDLGRRAEEIARAERGATARAVHAIVEQRWSAVPRTVPFGPLLPFGWVASCFWTAGLTLHRALTPARRLGKPVISIGGISFGGSGKTPAVRYLAQALAKGGMRPSVLTRGYRREGGEQRTVLAAGSAAPVEVTGDEAQLILRDGYAHLGIGTDRFRRGRQLQSQLATDIFILDDGFQHWGLHRDLDIIMLDGLDPFAGGSVVPLGRLREPVAALSRAHVIVIWRSEGRRFDGVLREIRKVNPCALVLLTETVPSAWVDAATGEPRPVSELHGVAVSAFCGIANPEAFRQTLLSLGCRLISFKAFPDHHRYASDDLQSLTMGEDAVIVTTEKDAVKLTAEETAPSRSRLGKGAVIPPILYLKIELRITQF